MNGKLDQERGGNDSEDSTNSAERDRRGKRKHPSPTQQQEGLRDGSRQLKKLSSKDPSKKTDSTKNVPKNFAKIILNFAISSHAKSFVMALSEVGGEEGIYKKFREFVMDKKPKASTIEALRALWTYPENEKDEETRYIGIIRKVSRLFLDEYAICWIFNSKIIHWKVHVENIYTMKLALENPENFDHLKE